MNILSERDNFCQIFAVAIILSYYFYELSYTYYENWDKNQHE